MLTTKTRSLSPRRLSRRGSTFTTVAVMSPVLMGFAAMGVDWGLVSVAQHQVQAAADAAAVAATTEMNDIDVAQATAQAYLARVRINDRPVSLDGITYGIWDGNVFTPAQTGANAVRVQAVATVTMPFADILGLSTVTVRAEAGAGPRVVARRAPDIVMVLDVTCSMDDAEVRAEKEAASAMLDCINDNATPDSRVSVVTFVGMDTLVQDMTEMQAGGYDTLYDAVDDIQSCRDGGAPCTHTNHSSGYEAALWVLDNADTPPDIGQAVLFMSDGEPVRYDLCQEDFYLAQDRGDVKFDLRGHCAALGQRWVNGRRGQPGRWVQNQPTLTDYTNWADAAKATADAAEIDVYTVYYGGDGTGIAFLEDHILTGENAFPGIAYTRDEIADKFVDVCRAYTVGNAGLLW